jgi:predicted RNase H-like HicB family nuclease
MDQREELLQELMDAIGEEGCGVSCEEATLFKDEEGWKMMLEGFMEPWSLGQTVDEAKARIREYASMGFGLS